MRRTLLLALVACAKPPVEHTPRSATLDTQHAAAPAAPHAIALPGATGAVFLDYLAYDPAHDRVWIPASGTGRVDVIDVQTEKITPIEGFVTKEFERRGKKSLTGPTAATVGDGVVYIGSRGDSSVCAVDAATLEKRDCVTLDSSPDGLQYVAATKEVWVTTPRDKSIRTLDVSTPSHPAAKDKITFEGEPEGFAVDNQRGTFYTNLEDKDETLAIDIKTHAITKHWQPKCGEDGPKGLVLDAPANHLVVVCPDHIETLDAGHDGAMLGTLTVGKGLDAIDFVPSRHLVAAAAGGASKIVFATLETDGKLTELATAPTAKGGRNAVLAANGTAFVAVGPSGSILVVPPPGAQNASSAQVIDVTMFGKVAIADGEIVLMDGGIEGVQGHTIRIPATGAPSWGRRLDGMQPSGKAGSGSFALSADEVKRSHAWADQLWALAPNGKASFDASGHDAPRWVWAIALRRGPDVRVLTGGGMDSPTGAPEPAKQALQWLVAKVDAASAAAP